MQIFHKSTLSQLPEEIKHTENQTKYDQKALESF